MFDFTIDAKAQSILQKMQSKTRINAQIENGINKMWYGLGAIVVNRAKENILNGKKTGNIYTFGFLRKGSKVRIKRRASAIASRKGSHQASAPGESPADLTGALRKGIHSTNSRSQLEFGYSSETPYGKFLELGTKKMAARPNIEPTALSASKVAEELSSQYIQQYIDDWLK